MRYDNPDIRDLIITKYVVGTLRGQAKKRFLALVASRSDWQDALQQVSQRVHLLADTLPAMPPPTRVWQTIQAKIFGAVEDLKPSIGRNWLVWWRALAIGSSGIAAVLAVLMFNQPGLIVDQPVDDAKSLSASANMGVLLASDTSPGWVMSMHTNNAGQVELKVMSLASLKKADNAAFELWLLPSDQSAPISLGLMPQEGKKALLLTKQVAGLVFESGLAVSLEPKGGSPTGQPTGEIVYQGQLTEI